MDYWRNEDKWSRCGGTSLYNSVLGRPIFTNEGSEPLTLAEVKEWSKIEQDADDSLITALIKAARRMCESYSGVGFISRTVTASINNPNGGFKLPYGPVTAGPTATDEDGNTIDLTYNFGQIQSPYGQMTVSYTAGHDELPEDLKTALKAQILFLYENRGESTVSISPIAKMILEPLREVV